MNNIQQDGGGQEEQLMQIIQAFAQMSQMDPQEIMQQLQQLPPEQQQEALQKMAQQVQGQEEQMQYGGLANNGFNRTMVNANNMTDPDYGVIPFLGMMDNDIGATLGILGGAASAISGSALGYSSLFNKKQPKSTGAFPTNPDITNKQHFKLSDPNKYFEAYENPYWKKYGKAQDGGAFDELDLSRLNPHSYFEDPRFGQTANYMDSRGPDMQPLMQQPNMSAPGGNKNNPNTINTSGPEIATNAMIGLGAVNTGLEHFEDRRRLMEYKRRMAALGNTNSMNAYNSPNAFGEYTTNTAAGTDNFRPNMHVPTQDFGTSFYAKCGGQKKKKMYKSGGEYNISEEELLDLMERGADIEFL